jgi:hypothetical protein
MLNNNNNNNNWQARIEKHLIAFTFVVSVGCHPSQATKQSTPIRAQPTAVSSGNNAAQPIAVESTALVNLKDLYGKLVQVVGTYRLKPIHSKGGRHLIATWPVVVLGDATEVMLGSFWEHEDGRSPTERPDYVDRQVRAVGVLHREPPKEVGAQNLIAPTLYPVQFLGLRDSNTGGQVFKESSKIWAALEK